MEVAFRYSSPDCLWPPVDDFFRLGMEGYTRGKRPRASFPMEICSKSGMGWDVDVRPSLHSDTASMLTAFSNAFFLGAPFNVAIFSIPQRFQIVNGTSPLGAGIRLLPFTCATPIGSIISSMIAGKAKVPPIYLVIAASCLQVVGFSLLSTLPVVKHISTAQYGYEVIAGFGVGINISTLVLMTPFSVQKRDQGMSTTHNTRFHSH